MRTLGPSQKQVQITDLSFAVFDALVPASVLDGMSLEQVIKYRKESESARQEFLDHLGVLQAKQAGIPPDGDYSGAVKKVVETEIVPAANAFKNKLQTINETLFGALAKGAVSYVGGSTGLNFFGDISWARLVVLAGLAGAYMGNAAVDALVAQRAAKRECSISYLISLD